MTLEELNTLPESDAYEAMKACCGSTRWVEGMLARRPFRSIDDVLATADAVWEATGPGDWLEAFAHHPRIGEKKPVLQQSDLAAKWSGGEQASVTGASDTLQDEIARANRQYEERFGRIYIVCATGKSAEELFATVKNRLKNDPDAELRIAAAEQGKITQLRLHKLLGVNS